MQRLLKAWAKAVAEAEFAEATAFCTTPGARARAAYKARCAERRAVELERVLRNRYGVDPFEMLRNGEIK